MSVGNWQQISAVFKSALEQPHEARGLFLDKACEGNASLREQVEKLLAAHEEAGSFFEKPVVGISTQEEECGEIIGSYRVIELLGAGGMGEVYLAEDLRLGRKVALKLLPAHFTSQQEQFRRFQQEARVISALNHPNILTVYEFGYSESRPFIAAEFIEGKTLREEMSQPASIEDALRIIEQIANALIAAHTSGIVHRDIKPENIMLRREDALVKVLDFGLAKLTESEETKNSSDPEAVTRILLQTTPGMVMGTVSYMSPEQARGLSVDERTDVWSLGIVFYELVTGRLPFAAPTRADALVAILERKPALDNLPIELQEIIGRCLKKDGNKRYQTVTEFLSDLQKLKDVSNGSFAKSFSMTSRDFQHTTNKQKKNGNRFFNKKTFAVLSLLLIAVLSFSIFYFRRESVTSSNNTNVAIQQTQKLYAQMSEEEKKAFIKQQSFRISNMMSEQTAELSDDAVKTIKQHLDAYASRTDNTSTQAFRENLNVIYERAAQNAPVINRAFKASSISPIVGLYVAMIESEYRECEESPIGAKGQFQFLKQTARRYNLSWEDICKIEKSAPAAAKMFEDDSAELGTDAKSMTLVLLSYNRGSVRVREDLRMLRSLGEKERSFWIMFENADKLDRQFQQESKHYVPKFFAAAIVGENPFAFGLKIKPLSEQ